MTKILISFFVFVLVSCGNESNSYFPLKERGQWSYEVKITPEIENQQYTKK